MDTAAESAKAEVGQKPQKAKQASPLAFLMKMAGPHRRLFVVAGICAVVGVVSGIVPFWAVANILTGLFGGQTDSAFFLIWCLVALCGFVGKVLFANISNVIAHRAAFGTLKELRLHMLSKLQRLPMGDLLNTPSGQLTNTVVNKVESLESTLAHVVPELAANILVPVALIVYLFVIDWRMALVALAVVIIGMPFMAQMASSASLFAGSVKTKERMNGVIVEFIGGIKEIKVFCQNALSYRKYHDAVIDNASYAYEWMHKSELGMAGYMVIFPASLLTVLPVGCLFVANGSLSTSDFITIMIVSLSAMAPILAISTFASNLATMGVGVDAIRAIIEAPELLRAEDGAEADEVGVAEAEAAEAARAATPILSLAGRGQERGYAIELDDVHFSYLDGQEVLRGVSLSVPPGSTVAIVGPSGSGKSTVARLIAGFWDTSEGTVSIGGRRLQDYSQAQLSKLVAYVDQDNYLFDDTVRNNIRVGQENASDAEVAEAARASGCEPFILSLEKGYDTLVGSSGSNLSGGERQRIAIARAMLHDAPIVVLDESTAYMDPENEAVVQDSISRLVQGKTLVVIAHRLSTVCGSDQIVVMDNGAIVQTGRHEELLRECPLYADMWNAHITVKDGDEQC
jgi:ATP-binding cassette subfamily B protein